MFKKILFYKIKTPVIIIFFIFIYGSGFLIGKYISEEQTYLDEKINLSLFEEVLNSIEKRYIYSDSLDYNKLMEGAVSGMVESLEDYPSTFFNKEESKRFLEDTMGNFEGVGMEIDSKDGELYVVTPLEGTPAEESGIRAGDKIIKIDDIITSEITIEEAVSLIRGEKGTNVNLTIFRSDWDDVKEITITRGVIEIPSMRVSFIEENNIKLAYIKLIHFSSNSSSDFSQLAKKILNNNVNGLILDLRNNPGGYLTEANKIAEWFLKEGDIITIQEGKDNSIEYKSNKNGSLNHYPIAIIINRGSASASEILASAIKENYDATIIGEQSFGKGSVQEFIRLSGGSSLKLTVAKWLTPKRNLIEGVGITPDIEIEFTEQDYNDNNDTQLNKAIEILQDII